MRNAGRIDCTNFATHSTAHTVYLGIIVTLLGHSYTAVPSGGSDMKQDGLTWYAWYLNVDKCLELALQHIMLVIMVT